MHSGHASAMTDDDGRFEMFVNGEEAVLVTVRDDRWAAPAQVSVVREGQAVPPVVFTLSEATIVEGVVTVGDEHRLAPGQSVTLSMRCGEIPAELKKPGDRLRREIGQSHIVQTDGQGHFRFTVGPGKYQLRGPPQTKPFDFTITG